MRRPEADQRAWPGARVSRAHCAPSPARCLCTTVLVMHGVQNSCNATLMSRWCLLCPADDCGGYPPAAYVPACRAGLARCPAGCGCGTHRARGCTSRALFHSPPTPAAAFPPPPPHWPPCLPRVRVRVRDFLCLRRRAVSGEAGSTCAGRGGGCVCVCVLCRTVR